MNYIFNPMNNIFNPMNNSFNMMNMNIPNINNFLFHQMNIEPSNLLMMNYMMNFMKLQQANTMKNSNVKFI